MSLRITTRFLAREALRDRSMWIGTALLTIALLLAGLSGIARLDGQRRNLREADAHAERSLGTLRAKADDIRSGAIDKPSYWTDPSDIRGFGYHLMVAYAQKPPLALGALTAGVSDVLPDIFRVSAGPSTDLASSYDLANPGRLELGRLDMSFVIIFLLPLTIVAAGHAALALDRDSGRLPLLALHGVSARRVTVLRLLLRAGILLAVSLAVPLATMLASAGLAASDAALATWLALALGYGLFWSAVTLLVVAIVRRAAPCALALGALWTLLVLIVPWLVALVVEQTYPPPPRVAQILAGRAATDEVLASQSQLLGRYLLDHPEFGLSADSATADDYTKRQITTAALVDTRQAASDAAFEPRIAARRRIVGGLAWLSPPLLAERAMAVLSGNDAERQASFFGQTRDYVTTLRGYFDPRVLRGDKAFNEWNAWPRFAWREPPRATVVTGALVDAAGLLVLAMLLAAMGWAKLGRITPSRGEQA